MGKIFKFSIYLLLVFCFSLALSGCSSKNEVPSEDAKQAAIGDVNYTSLTEAVEHAKTGDIISIYNDVRDNKNVTIDKPLTIKGVLNSSQNKPKFYGCLTINLNGEEDSASIENLEIIHQGTQADGENNDTRVGLNLIDGGLVFKSNVISLDEASSPDPDATGIIISRKIDSINTMPILVKGNRFAGYETDNETLSSAMIIKRNKPNLFKNIAINEREIFNQNAFSTTENGNQFISISYSTTPAKVSYFATNSVDELVKALREYQDENGTNFILFPTNPLKEIPTEEITLNEKSTLTIEGASPADFSGMTLNIAGAITVNSDISNITLVKTNSTASIIISENAQKQNVTIK